MLDRMPRPRADLPSVLLRAAGCALLAGAVAAAPRAATAADPDVAATVRDIREQLDDSVRLLDAGDREAAERTLKAALEALEAMGTLPRRPPVFRPLLDRAAGVRRRFEKAGIEVAGGGGAAPAESPPARSPQVGGRAAISFSTRVAPILVRSCGGCHVIGKKGDFQMASYQGLMQSGMVQRGAGTSSRLVEVILTGDMPRGGGTIAAADVETLIRWIDAGAPGDVADPTTPLDAVVRGGGGPPASRSAPVVQPVTLAPGEVSFAIDVAPTLATHCLKCHGGDETENGLSMATLEALLRGGRGGAAVTPRSGAASLLVRKLRGADIEGQRMPLNAPPLPVETIATITAWIDQGARLDMLTGRTPLDVVVAAGRTRSLSDEALADVRIEVADKAWRRAIPDERPLLERRPEVCLIGNLAGERMVELADTAAEAVAAVRRELDVEGPLLKGGIVVFVAGKGYDYSTLWQTMLGGERPRGMTSHFGITGEVAYGALLVPDGSADLEASITEAVVAAAFAGRSAPEWFARGAGRALASRLVPKSPLVRTWRSAAAQAAAAVPAADLLAGQAADAVAAAAAAGGFVGAIGTGSRLGQMLARLDDGLPFDAAFTKTFAATPADACATWAARAAKRR